MNDGARDLFVIQYLDETLGNASHLVASRGSGIAAVIDPFRHVDPYLADADRLGVRIEYTLDTHLHNDFVSGSRELAARTSAVVGASADAELAFELDPSERETSFVSGTPAWRFSRRRAIRRSTSPSQRESATRRSRRCCSAGVP